MTDQAGFSVGALQQRQVALASRHSATAEADRVLAETLAGVHEAMRESVRRLDVIAGEIERAQQLMVDTPLAAREFQKLLVVKQREIAAVVADARGLSRTKSAVLQGLREQYPS
jgi:hypothetical protein